jgi:hypothetical protein
MTYEARMSPIIIEIMKTKPRMAAMMSTLMKQTIRMTRQVMRRESLHCLFLKMFITDSAY